MPSSYGNISMERDPFAANPTGGFRPNADPMDRFGPWKDSTPDPSVIAAIEARRRRIAEQSAQAASRPTIDVSDRNTTNPERLGEPLQGIEKYVSFTPQDTMSGNQVTDVYAQAGNDVSMRHKPVSWQTNGQNYSFQPRARISQKKAQTYIELAQQERAQQEKAANDRMAKLEKTAADKKAEADTQYTRMVEQQDKFDARARQDATDALTNRERAAQVSVAEAKAREAERQFSPEGRREAEDKNNAATYEALLANPNIKGRARAFAAQSLAAIRKQPGLETAFSDTYEEKKASVQDAIDAFKESITDYGAIASGADVKNAQGKLTALMQRAQMAGMTPQELATLKQEFANSRLQQGFFPFVGKLLTGQW